MGAEPGAERGGGGGPAPGPGGVPKPKQWPRIITRRRIPEQKKEDRLCVAPGSRRYLESAGGGRRSDYSLRGAPHPRAAELMFPWGGVSPSRGGDSLQLSFWESFPFRLRALGKPPSPLPPEPISPRLSTRELPPKVPGSLPRNLSPVLREGDS